MVRTFFGLILMAWCCGCSSPPEPVPPDRDAQALDVYEAVFRHQLQKYAPGRPARTTFYLFIDSHDPSPEFLQRFARQKPPVKKGSRSQPGKGVNLHVENLHWLDEHTALVKGGHADGKDGSGNRYRVERRAGKWVVVEDVVEVMS
jgi:hypothetical protein